MMAYITKTVPIGSSWTLVTSSVALLQFNDEMYMALTGGTTPAEIVGFTMDKGEKYINASDSMSVWAKTKMLQSSGIESVRVSENVI
jgi:hypothetical protein